MADDATTTNDPNAAGVETSAQHEPTHGGEEGQVPASTPSESTVPSTQSGQEPGGKSQLDDSAKRAQAAERQDEIDRKALAALDDGQTVDSARKIARESEPSATAATGGEGQHGEKPGLDQRGTNPADSGTSYEGLDASARQTLSQAHLLPDTEAWKGMPPKYREALVNSARELVASKTRDFQRQAAQTAPRDSQGRFQPMDPAPAAGSSQQTTPASSQQAGQGTQQAQSATVTPPAGTQAGNGTQTSPQLRGMDKVRKFAEELGTDLAAPLLEGLQELDGERSAEFKAMEQRLSQVAQGSQYALQRLVAQEETTARATLAKDIPAVNDPTKWEQVKTNAKVFAQAAYNSGAHFTWEDSLVTAARALFSPDLQQQAQKRLAEQRTSSLQGTPERGTAQAKPSRAMSKDDWDAAALEALESGKSVEEVRSMRH
jgi:hypothetical protein